MKTLFAKHKWMQLVYGALLLAAGILIIIFAINDKANVAKWLSIITAITLFIYAAALIFTGIFSLKDRYFDLAFIYAVVFIAVGVVLLVNNTMLGQFITIFVATLLCAMGLIEVGEATAMVFFKKKVFTIVLFYLLGAAFITLGVLAFSFQNEVEQIIYVGVGALLCVTAVIELVLGGLGLLGLRKAAKAEKDKVIDVEVKENNQEEKQIEQAEAKDDQVHEA